MAILAAIHIPGYNYCGPGTEDFTAQPVNALDAACRRHDLAYAASTSRKARMKADLDLYLAARKQQFRYPGASALVQMAMLTAPGAWYRG